MDIVLHSPNRFIESNGLATAYNGAHFQGPYRNFGGAVLDRDLRQTGQSSVELFADMIGSQALL
jgi:hypothetical protein